MTLVVLTALILNANRMIIEGEKDIVKGESYDIAVNYAQALLKEIAGKKFDLATKDSVWQDPSEFTSPYSLGPSSTEYNQINPKPDVTPFKTIAAYNDVDDYNGYERFVNTEVVQEMLLSVKVYYVTDSQPDIKVYYQTYFKRVVVTASHPTYLNDVEFSTLATN